MIENSTGCTQSALAQMLGVSQMTVHRALNGHPSVSAALRDRILQAAAQQGYRPSASARAMRSGRFGVIAMLASARPYHSHAPQRLMDGIHDELVVHDLHLLTARLSDSELTDEAFVPKILREWMADGLLIDYIQDIPQRLVEIIERHQIPAIYINSKQKFDCVHPDDFDAGQRATEHLLKLGHRRVVFADFSHSSRLERQHYSAKDRCDGYLSAMQKARLEPQILRGEASNIPPRDWLYVCAELLRKANRPKAIVAYRREVAPLAVAALQLGLRVPEDLSLVTFDQAEAEFAGLPLTMMTLPEHEMGQSAVRLLQQKMVARTEKLPAQAIRFVFSEGATCAPLR